MTDTVSGPPGGAHKIGRLQLGEISFDPVSGCLRGANDEVVQLRPQSLEVLEVLARNAGEVVHRDTLMAEVWKDVAVTDDSLIQCISDIRRAIGDSDRKILQTLPRKGYRLMAVRPASEGRVRTGKPERSWTRMVIGGLVAAILVLVAGLAVSGLIGQGKSGVRVAVLPFENHTGSQRWARLGQGLSMDISEELARHPGLGVIGAESVRDVSKRPPKDAAAELDADFVLGGDIESSGEMLHLSARLFDGETGELIWADRWIAPITGYEGLRDEIANQVNARIVGYFWFGAINIAVAEKARTKPAHSLSAYEAYLLGIEQILWTRGDYVDAMQQFQRAVEIDPGFARAWLMIGNMKQWIGDVSPEDTRRVLHAESLDAYRRAYAHDPNDAMVQATMSLVHLAERDVEAAQDALLRAVSLAPNSTDVLAVAAWQALPAGIDGAVAQSWARRAVELNPKAPPWHRMSLGMAAFLAEDYETCVQVMAGVPPHHKKFLFLAAAHQKSGNAAAAAAAVQNLRDAFPDYRLAGDYDIAMNAGLERLFQAAKAAGVPP